MEKKTILKVRIDEDDKPKYAGDLWYLLEQRLRSERNSKLKHIFIQSETFTTGYLKPTVMAAM